MRTFCLLVMLFAGASARAEYTLINPYVIDAIPRGSSIMLHVGNRLPSSMSESEARELISTIGALVRAEVDVTIVAGNMSPASLCDNKLDGISTICFGNTATIAAKCPVPDTEPAGCAGMLVDVQKGEFVEINVWLDDAIAPEARFTVWAHEIMHGLGSSHSTNPQSIMYEFGSMRSDLHEDDKGVLKCLFPEDLADYALQVSDSGYLHLPHLTALHLPGRPVYSVGAQLEMLNGAPYRLRVVSAELYRPNGDKDIGCKDVSWHHNVVVRLPRVLYRGQVYVVNVTVEVENGTHYMYIMNATPKQR